MTHTRPFLQRCYEIYSQNPASLLEEQIEGGRRRVSQLQLKIRQEMGELGVSGGGAELRGVCVCQERGGGTWAWLDLSLPGKRQQGSLPSASQDAPQLSSDSFVSRATDGEFCCCPFLES